MTGSFRRCIIVCGQAKDDEAQIWFKVLEYHTKRTVAMQGLMPVTSKEYIAIDPSKMQITDALEALEAQLTNGVQTVTKRIQQAIGQ
ncbi:MAG: hypothetical protein ACLQSR_15585 [Limisphaerales bacterium]